MKFELLVHYHRGGDGRFERALLHEVEMDSREELQAVIATLRGRRGSESEKFRKIVAETEFVALDSIRIMQITQIHD